jgi:hypothetical protein
VGAANGPEFIGSNSAGAVGDPAILSERGAVAESPRAEHDAARAGHTPARDNDRKTTVGDKPAIDDRGKTPVGDTNAGDAVFATRPDHGSTYEGGSAAYAFVKNAAALIWKTREVIWSTREVMSAAPVFLTLTGELQALAPVALTMAGAACCFAESSGPFTYEVLRCLYVA